MVMSREESRGEAEEGQTDKKVGVSLRQEYAGGHPRVLGLTLREEGLG